MGKEGRIRQSERRMRKLTFCARAQGLSPWACMHCMLRASIGRNLNL